MSEIKVNKITPKQNCTQVTLGDSGDTFVIPSGVTITNNGTQTGFGRTGTVDWDTTAKTASFTAVSGNGYFVNTTSGAVTVTLPASPSAGDIVAVSDYANTTATNAITVARNRSNIEGSATDLTMESAGIALTFVYVDGTRGWKVVNSGREADKTSVNYMTATGGTITCCGNYKIHTFTGPGTFTVTCTGDTGLVDYLVVAGGGGGGKQIAGAGGAGGFRESHQTSVSGCYTASPLAVTSAFPVSATSYPITVGGGGAGGTCASGIASDGSNSVFSTITSTGGGAGHGNANANPGGSGGGGGLRCGLGGSGNTPPTSPPQGNPGGNAVNSPGGAGGGGGGAGAAGTTATGPTGPSVAGPGGNGVATLINPATGESSGGTRYYAGGGGGGGRFAPGNPDCASPGTGGLGGGGNGSQQGGVATCSGTANTGGGGGGSGYTNSPVIPGCTGGAGGSGIVIIRYKFQ